MQRPWTVLIRSSVIALIIFLVPMAVGYPNNWFISLPPALRVFIVASGILAILVFNYNSHKEKLDQRDAEINRLRGELKEEKAKFAAFFMRWQLRELLGDLMLIGKGRAYVYLLDPENNHLSVAYEYGMDESPDSSLELESGHGWAWLVWQTGDEVYYDLEKHRRAEIMIKFGLSSGEYRAIRIAGVRSVLTVPIIRPNNVDERIGILCIDITDQACLVKLNTRNVQYQVSKQANIFALTLVNAGLR